MEKKQYIKKIKELEDKIKDLSVKDEICDWITYENKQCKRHSICNYGSYKFCKLHKKKIADYKINKNPEDLCDSFENVKVIPRSHKQIKYFMKEIDNEETIVKVLFPGGCVEEADISEDDYILLLSDDSKFYYNYKRGDFKAKDLKLLLRKYCKNESVIEIGNTKYCEECYMKIKNFPKLELFSKDDNNENDEDDEDDDEECDDDEESVH